MTIVQNRPGSPGGPHADRAVFFELLAPGGVGYTEGGDIVGRYTDRTDETGLWSVDLVPTNQITPASPYQVTEEGVASVFTVPASGGPYNLAQLLVTDPPTPAAPGITGVQVAADGTVAGSRPEVNLIPGTGIAITAADNSGGNRVDVTVTATGGAGGAVISVNGQPGPTVDLGAADVDAIPAETFGTANGVATLDANGKLTGAQGSAYLTAGNIGAAGAGASVALVSTDPSTSNARTPTVHAASHAAGGGDPVTPAAIGAIPSSAAGAASGVATLDANGKLTAAQATNLTSRQILIVCSGQPSTVTAPVGTWTPSYLTNTATGNYVGWVTQSDGAQNDSISFDFASGAGTYSLELYYLPFTNRGIYTIKIDAIAIGTIDGYAASLSPQRGIVTGIALTAGQHTVTLTMATKNPSSSSYIGMVDKILLTRTA